MEKPPEDKQKPARDKLLRFLAYEAAIEFALLLIVPLGTFLFLNHKYNPDNQSKAFTIIGLLLALAVSAAAIGRRIIDYKNRLK